jgi:tRNA(Ile)-lysidine synthase
MSLVKRAFSRWIDDLEETPQILVGFSGGVDSSVLLHALVACVKSKHITAIHINHGLSKNADLWEIHARRFCEDLGVDFVGTSVSVVSDGSGLENAARTARYEVYESLLQKAGILLLGHHMDDQVETMLYRLMRGAGHKGMSGIPLKRSVGQGYLVRPLLQVGRKDLEIYANDFHIEYIEDESNLKEDFDRNYLRRTIIPSIENRWPSYRKRFIEMARISDESDTLLESLAGEDIAKLDQREERAGWSLCLQLFKELDLVRQNNILRYWGTMNGMAALNRTVISEILSTIINSRIDSSPQICVEKAQFRRY